MRAAINVARMIFAIILFGGAPSELELYHRVRWRGEIQFFPFLIVVVLVRSFAMPAVLVFISPSLTLTPATARGREAGGRGLTIPC